MDWEKEQKFQNKLIAFGVVVIMLVFAFVSCGSSEKEDVVIEHQKEQRIEYAGIEEYEVGPFETLSHIAVKYIPSDDYMQQWIKDVQRLNGRNNSTIYSGEVIKVFVYDEKRGDEDAI